MPFTLAHPAAVLPVKGLLPRYTVLSALVIGSVMPDVVYFIPLGINATQTHRLIGIVWFCVPLGLAGYLVFRLLLKRPLTHLMPRPVRVRLLARGSGPRRGWGVSAVVVLASLAIGALTHVAWDAFTHRTGAAVRAWPALRVTVFTIGPYTVRLYKALQYGCTVLGFVVMAVWLVAWLRRTPRPAVDDASPLRPVARFVVLASLLAVPAAVGLTTAWRFMPRRLTLPALQSFAHRASVAGVTALLAALIALGLLWPIVEARARSRSRKKGSDPITLRGLTPFSRTRKRLDAGEGDA